MSRYRYGCYFYINVGQDVHFVEGNLEDAINEGGKARIH